MSTKLNPKQEAFCQEFLVDLCGKAAAERAGYSKRSAVKLASQLLDHPRVAARIKELMDARTLQTQVTAEMVIAELAKIGFSNMLDYIEVNPDGRARVDLSKLTRDQASAITEVQTEEVLEGSGENALEIEPGSTESGVSTGLPSLDKVLSCRGYPCGQVSIVQAGTNVGKTPFLTQSAYDCWKRGGRVLYALFADLTPNQWKSRLYKLVSGRGSAPKKPEQEEMFGCASEYDEWRRTVAELNDPYDDGRFVFFNCRSGQSHTIETFKAACLKASRKAAFDMVCIDYLQAIGTSNQKVSMHYERVSHVAQVVNELAFAMPQTATVLASQVTVKEGGKSVARYGAEAEQDCGFQVEIVREKGAVDCAMRVQKNRFGDTGLMEGFEFDKSRLRFVDPLQR